MKSKDGNLISFRVIVDEKGTLVTELSSVPDKELSKIFKESDLLLIRKVLNDIRPKLEGLHEFLEKEIQFYFTT